MASFESTGCLYLRVLPLLVPRIAIEELRAAVNTVEPGAIFAARSVAPMGRSNPWRFLPRLQRKSVGLLIMLEHLWSSRQFFIQRRDLDHKRGEVGRVT